MQVNRGSDRQRIHIEDFAQVFSVLPDHKYEGVNYKTITQMVWTLTGEEGLRDFIKRLAYTIVIGNGDMHLKNWSFIYRDAITPELSPAYDMVSTIAYISHDTLALKLLKVKDMQLCDLALFEELAAKAGVPKKLVTDTAKETADCTRTVWNENKHHYNLPKDIETKIDQHIKDVPL